MFRDFKVYLKPFCVSRVQGFTRRLLLSSRGAEWLWEIKIFYMPITLGLRAMGRVEGFGVFGRSR